MTLRKDGLGLTAAGQSFERAVRTHFGAAACAPHAVCADQSDAYALHQSHEQLLPEQEDRIRKMVIRAIAAQLYRDQGGNSVLNWLEAEVIVDHLSDAEHSRRRWSQPNDHSAGVRTPQENQTRSIIMKCQKNSPIADESRRKKWNRDEARAPSAHSPARGPTDEQIRARAYEVWLSQGSPCGRDMECWCQAEQELASELRTD
ncbi:MAG: DUF2934 domain-containing protein [Phycisphaerales bacterium]|nr:DUF2934 domain-containing protein [Phycisphaerales bacterium]